MKLGSTCDTKGISFPSRTYRVDGGRQFLVWVFFLGGLTPLMLDQDAPATADKVAAAAPKFIGTC
jgi:hypothetical protein